MNSLSVVVLTTVLVAMGAAVEPQNNNGDSERIIGTVSNPIIPKVNPLQDNIENALLWAWRAPQEDTVIYPEEPVAFPEGTKSLCQLKELIESDEEEGTTKRGAMPMQALASGRFGRSSFTKKIPLAALSTGRFGRSVNGLEKMPIGALTAGRFGRSEEHSKGLPLNALMAGRFGRSTGLERDSRSVGGLKKKVPLEALVAGRFGRSGSLAKKVPLEALAAGRFGRSSTLTKKVPLEALASGRFGRSSSLTKKVPLAALVVGRFGRDKSMAPRALRRLGTVSLRMPLAALASGRFGRSVPTEENSDESKQELEARENAREEETEVVSQNDGGHGQLQKGPNEDLLTLSAIPRMNSQVSRRRFDFSKLPLAALKTGRFKRQRDSLDGQRDGIVPTEMPDLTEGYGSDSTVRYSPSMALSAANHVQGTDRQDDYM
ncbi:uncharacterized protein LOC144881633 [Branchiostoma floridae x Branchiostoma japonicum]